MLSKSDLEYFMEIARCGHVSRAAKRLGVTQPSLSHCIRRMEESLGATLFIRTKKGVHLTRSGQRLYNESEQLKQSWERVIRAAKDDIDKAQGLIQIGCHTAVAQYALPRLISHLAKDYPDIHIRLKHGLSRHVTEEVISSQLDVAIAVNPVRHNDLIIKQLCEDIVSLWAPQSCANPTTLILTPELIQSQEIIRKLHHKKIIYKKYLESSSLEVVAKLLQAGIGHAILPKRVVESMGVKNVHMVLNSPTYKDHICLIYKSEFRKTERGRIFINSAIHSIK